MGKKRHCILYIVDLNFVNKYMLEEFLYFVNK